jgi:hypothetical protein
MCDGFDDYPKKSVSNKSKIRNSMYVLLVHVFQNSAKKFWDCPHKLDLKQNNLSQW